jgi:hypothetical protein
MVAHVGGGIPPATGRRGSGGCRLGGQGATASLGRGHCGEGKLRGKPERPTHAAVLSLQGCDREARRGEHEGEAFGIELAEVIGMREGGARGHGKPRRDRNPWAVHGGQKTSASAISMVWTGDARSKTDSGSVTVALGWAQFGAH